MFNIFNSERDTGIHKYWDKSKNSIRLYAGLVQIRALEETREFLHHKLK